MSPQQKPVKVVYIVEINAPIVDTPNNDDDWTPISLYSSRNRAVEGYLHYVEIFTRDRVRLAGYARVAIEEL